MALLNGLNKVYGDSRTFLPSKLLFYTENEKKGGLFLLSERIFNEKKRNLGLGSRRII